MRKGFKSYIVNLVENYPRNLIHQIYVNLNFAVRYYGNFIITEKFDLFPADNKNALEILKYIESLLGLIE